MEKEIVYHVKSSKSSERKATLVMRREDDSNVVRVGWSQPCTSDNFSRKSGRDEASKKLETITNTDKTISLKLSDEWGIKDNCRTHITFLIADRIDVYLERASKYFKEAKSFEIPTRDGGLIKVEID